MRLSRLPALVVALAACSADHPATATAPADVALGLGPSSDVEYEVTITNLTTGQPLSPPLLVTHAQRVALFTPGAPASAGVQAIAENGDPSVAASMLAGASGVHTVTTIGAPIHRIGGPGATSVTTRIAAGRDARWLSLATMLICSNDGFAAVRDLHLPLHSRPVTAYAMAYDAGSEVNTESATDIVPPCFGIGPVSGPAGGAGRIAENSVVRMHGGIAGGAALVPGAHGWSGPVAMVTVQRVAN